MTTHTTTNIYFPAALLSLAMMSAGLAGIVREELEDLKGSDPRKLALAQLVWKRTCVSQEWIANQLSMKSAANVSQQLRRLGKKRIKGLPVELREFIKRATQD